MAEDQITNNPANIGEVNLTLRYMQKAQTEAAVATKEALKEINAKLDSITSNAVTIADFLAYKVEMENYKRHIETTYVTKEASSIPFKLAYGFAAIILTGFIGALVAFFIQSR